MCKKLLLPALLFLCSLAQAQTLFQENFNTVTDLPAGWSQTTNASDGGWLVGVPSDLSSQAFSVPGLDGNALVTNDDGCNCDKSNEIVRLPAMNFSGQTAVYLIFSIFYFDAAYQGDQESLQLLASTDGGTNWTLVKQIGGRGAWRNEAVNVSAYAGQASVQFAFRYDDGGGWLYGVALDNIRAVVPDNVVKASVAQSYIGRYVDAIPAVLDGYQRGLAGQTFSIASVFNNDGFPAVNSFTATWSNGTETATQTFTGLNLQIFETYEFTMDIVPLALGSNSADYTLTISNINGGADNDASDNSETMSFDVEGIEPAPGRKVVMEEGTGTWCQWCPRGAVMMDFIAEQYPTLAIPIAVHNGNSNPMRNTAYDTGMGALISGYPSGLVDRADGEFDPIQFEAQMMNRLAEPVPVRVQHNVAYNPTTRQISVESRLKFQEAVNGNYRIAVVITEDDVTGTSSGYNQQNVYSGGANGPMGGYENLPFSVPAAQMVYNHVARQIVGGFGGAANSVPTTNPAGSEHSYTSNWTHPAAQDVTQMHAITLLINNATGEIVNGEQTAIPFTIVDANEPLSELVSVEVFPNPVSEKATLRLNLQEQAEVQVRLTDLLGKVVFEANYGKLSGEQQLAIRLKDQAAGTYMLSVNADGHMVTKPLVVLK